MKRLSLPGGLVQRFFSFSVVGASGLLVDTAVLSALVDGLGGPILISKVLAAEIAMVNNFLWNDRWTFGDLDGARGGWTAVLKRFLKFNAFCGIGLVIQVATLQLFAMGMGWNLYLSNLIAIAVATLWNFGMNYWRNWGGRRVAHD